MSENNLSVLIPLANKTSLALPAKMSFGQWREVGLALHTCKGATNWWMGDWVNAGEAMFKDKAIQVAAEVLDIDPGTMTTIVSVCNAFPAPRRRELLSFAHHQEVYSLTPEAQNKWLDAAVLGNWTRAEMREHMTEAGAKPKAAPRKKNGTVQKLPTTELYNNLKGEIEYAMQAVPPLAEVCGAIYDGQGTPTRDQLEMLRESVQKTIVDLNKVLDTVEELLAVEEKAA